MILFDLVQESTIETNVVYNCYTKKTKIVNGSI